MCHIRSEAVLSCSLARSITWWIRGYPRARLRQVEHGTSYNVLRVFTWEPGPESGLNCLRCAEFGLDCLMCAILDCSPPSTRSASPPCDYLPPYLFTYLPTYLPIYLPTYLFTYLPACLPTCPPTFLYLPAYIFTYLSTCLPTYLPTYLPLPTYCQVRFRANHGTP